MAATIKEDEDAPSAYPGAPAGLSAAAIALDSDFLWQRIESYVAYRWTARDVTWIVDGPGDWIAPLKPAEVSETYVWSNEAWEAMTLPASPLGGYALPGCGPYKIVATVGGNAAVPAAVNEAFRRLAEYLANIVPSGGIRQETIEGIGTTEFDTNATAKAMVASGAGDLLRAYRRAA
jgi:hypothetical protein